MFMYITMEHTWLKYINMHDLHAPQHLCMFLICTYIQTDFSSSRKNSAIMVLLSLQTWNSEGDSAWMMIYNSIRRKYYSFFPSLIKDIPFTIIWYMTGISKALKSIRGNTSLTNEPIYQWIWWNEEHSTSSTY